MTTTAQSPARVPTPRPNAPPAVSTSSDSATTSASTSRPPKAQIPPGNGQQQPAARRGPRAATPDPLGDRATAFLIRRALCPQHLDKSKGPSPPIDELLPPLTSRNDVDLQLYALIAIVLRE